MFLNPLYNNVTADPGCNLSAWDVSNVQYLDDWFTGVQFSNETYFDLRGWNTSNVESAIATFNNSNFNFPIDTWDLSNLLNATAMFRNSSFNQPLNSWTVTALVDATRMFQDAKQFNQDLDNWQTLSLQGMSYMFHGATDFNASISGWDVTHVKFMDYAFAGAESFNQPFPTRISQVLVSVESMFSGATSFNQPIPAWSGVQNMDHMFQYALSFNSHIALDVSQVLSMRFVFHNAHAFNRDLQSWDVSQVKDMSFLFSGCKAFNQPLDNWNPINVQQMNNMFDGATAFNESIFEEVSSVTTMEAMFKNAISFSQDLNAWDVSQVTVMTDMFFNATSFQGSIKCWNVQKVAQIKNMFGTESDVCVEYPNDLSSLIFHPLAGESLDYNSAFFFSSVCRNMTAPAIFFNRALYHTDSLRFMYFHGGVNRPAHYSFHTFWAPDQNTIADINFKELPADKKEKGRDITMYRDPDDTVVYRDANYKCNTAQKFLKIHTGSDIASETITGDNRLNKSNEKVAWHFYIASNYETTAAEASSPEKCEMMFSDSYQKQRFEAMKEYTWDENSSSFLYKDSNEAGAPSYSADFVEYTSSASSYNGVFIPVGANVWIPNAYAYKVLDIGDHDEIRTCETKQRDKNSFVDWQCTSEGWPLLAGTALYDLRRCFQIWDTTYADSRDQLPSHYAKQMALFVTCDKIQVLALRAEFPLDWGPSQYYKHVNVELLDLPVLHEFRLSEDGARTGACQSFPVRYAPATQYRTFDTMLENLRFDISCANEKNYLLSTNNSLESELVRRRLEELPQNTQVKKKSSSVVSDEQTNEYHCEQTGEIDGNGDCSDQEQTLALILLIGVTVLYVLDWIVSPRSQILERCGLF